MRGLDNHIDAITHRYTVEIEPMASIAKSYNTTRQAIFYALRRSGVDTGKSTRGVIDVKCDHCGNIHKETRANVRNRKHHFCDNDCYYAWLAAGGSADNEYIENRRSREDVRKLVSEYIDLLPGYIVHHEDRNQNNNDLSNLKVFSCQADHLRCHRGFDTKPIWDGLSHSPNTQEV